MTESNLLVRCRVIRDLLARYAELVDPMQARDGSGNGVALGLMPATYTPSVRELERLLRMMREDRSAKLVIVDHHAFPKVSVRRLWWHVNARYIAAGSRTVDRQVARKGKGGKRALVVERCVEPIVDRRVDEVLVTAAVAWIAQAWALRSEPMLPADLQVAA